MTRDEQNEALSQEGVQDISWHGYVSYVGIKDGNSVCGIVAYDGKLIVSVRPMSAKDHQDMIRWVRETGYA
jgi:hypothetical protein